MQPPWIILKGISYSLSEIQNWQFDSNSDAALIFCHDWLNGKNEFTLQTSGSTGNPKTISVTRNQLWGSAQRTFNYLNLKQGYTALVCLDTRYIAGIMMLVRSLVNGMNLIIVDPTSNPLEKIPDVLKVDFSAFVPYQLETILCCDQKIKLNTLKTVLIGGAPISKELESKLNELSPAFYATYGMTETLSHIALQKLNGANAERYFNLLPGISLDVDQRGCLVVHDPLLSPGPIITNDLVERISENQFRWLGRFDNIINSGGVKVIPEKIESAITPIMAELKLVNKFFIAGVPDHILGEAVILFIEGEKPDTSIEKILMQRVKETLGKYEAPKSIRYVPKFIQTDTGKVNKIKTLELTKIK